MTDTVRALWVGGPLDGKIETAHRPPTSGYSLTVEGGEEIAYRGLPLKDLDGTTIVVYALEHELVPGPPGPRGPGPRRPPLTVWELAVRLHLAQERDAERRWELERLTRRTAAAVAKADDLAGELRELRDAPYHRRVSSGDA